MPRTTPDEITAAVIASYDGCPDPRLRTILTSLVRHLHAFAADVQLTEREWSEGIAFLTATGKICDDRRQEFVLLSDTLGLSMLVDALAHDLPAAATESTVLGPFHTADAPPRAYGDSIVERPSGVPAWVQGRVLDTEGEPLGGAVLDIWQNGEDGLYAVQDPTGPEENLRGLFTARDDGSYAFLAVRPTDYSIPADGPVGRMLAASDRHSWRPAHLHAIVSAPGHVPLVTHIFDSESRFLDSDAVFGVKGSLIRTFVEHAAGDDAGRPAGVEGRWYSLDVDFVLARDG